MLRDRLQFAQLLESQLGRLDPIEKPLTALLEKLDHCAVPRSHGPNYDIGQPTAVQIADCVLLRMQVSIAN